MIFSVILDMDEIKIKKGDRMRVNAVRVWFVVDGHYVWEGVRSITCPPFIFQRYKR